MQKELTFNSEARDKLIRGVEKLAAAVKATLGPKGRNVLIERAFNAPQVTKDGVTVAKEISLADPVENLGAQIVKQAAAKTVAIAGDGTTTSTVLAEALVKEGNKYVRAGISPSVLKEGMELALGAFVDKLNKIKIDIDEKWDKVKQVATLSANGDTSIGELLAEGFKTVGKDGVIAIQDSKTAGTYIEVVQGVKLDRGYISPYFVNDRKKMTADFEDCYVFITDKKLRGSQDVVPILEIAAKHNKPLLIIADEVEAQALSLLVVNRMRASIRVAAIKAPAFGDRRRAVLEDMCALTGATLISEDKGFHLKDATVEHFGKADQIIVGREHTTIIGGAGSETSLKERLEVIEAEFLATESDYERDKLKERKAALGGGVAVIHVGAHTDVELGEKKDRLDDALHATTAALQEGIVLGAGQTFLNIKKELSKEFPKDNLGAQAFLKALESPLRTICANADVDYGMIQAEVATKNKGSVLNAAYGYDARNNEVTELLKAGIIDPAMVLRVATENAVSVASMLLSTEVTIHEKEVPDDYAPDTNGISMDGMFG